MASVPQSVIDKAVDKWRTRLRTCVKAKALHHFEHLLYTSADFRRDLTGSFQSHSRISEEDNIQNRSFLWLMILSGSVAT